MISKRTRKKRSRKAASSRRRCRKNGPGSKQGLCHLTEGLALAALQVPNVPLTGSEIFLFDQLGTLELQFHQFKIKFLFLKFIRVN